MKKVMMSALALLAMSLVCAKAQTITADGDSVVAPTTPAPGDVTDYDYFSSLSNGGVNGGPTVLNNFSDTYIGSAFGGGGIAGTAPDGTPSSDGSTFGIDLYNHDDTDGMLLTFQVINPAETSFNVYVLGDTYDTTGNSLYNPIILSSSGSLSTATGTFTSATHPSNDYTEFTVVGATTSDVFTLAGQGGYGDMSGITFQNVTTAVPEPSTCALMGAGVFFVALLRRFRRLANS